MVDINSNTHLVTCEEIEYFIPTKIINLTEGKLEVVHKRNTFFFYNAITD